MESNIVTVSVRDRRVSASPRTVVANGIKSDRIALDLDARWAGLSAVVYLGGCPDAVALKWEGSPVEIPASVLAKAGWLAVSVVGYDAAGAVRVTTAEAPHALEIVHSGCYDGVEPPPDAPDLIGQLVAAGDRADYAANRADASAAGADAAAARADAAAADAESHAVRGARAETLPPGSQATAQLSGGVLAIGVPRGEKGAPGAPGADGKTPVRGVDYWTAEDRAPVERAAARAEGAAAGATNAAGAANSAAAGAANAATRAEGAAEAAERGETARVQAEAEREAAFAASKAAADGAAADASSAASKAKDAATRADAAADRAESRAGNILRGKAGGAVAHMDDAWPSAVLGAAVHGKSEQATTTGANVFDPSKVPARSANGVAIAANPDGTVAVRGTASGLANLNLAPADFTLPEGQWTLTVDGLRDAQVVLQTADGKIFVSTDTGKTFANAATQTLKYFLVQVQAGKTVDSTFKLWLEKGATALREPFTGGMPSPSPECPQPISSVGRVEVRVSGNDTQSYVSTPIDLQGHELRSLPDGTRDEVVIDGEGNASLVKRVGRTSAAATDGVSGEVGTDCMSSTGELADGADVLYTLATPQTVPLGKVAAPRLPETVSNVWAATDVPTTCAVDYERDVTAAFGKLEGAATALARAAL